MRCHFKILIIATCVAGALPVAARGDDETLDFFKRFLDSSPRTEQQSTDLADDWINKVTRSQDSSSSEVESLREPIRVAQKPTRAAVPRPAVPRPAAPRSTVSDPIPTPQADPISQPQVAELSEADMRAAKQLEAKVNRQVQNLQVQLEREEKALEQQLATFGKRREVALEKADEKELERIQKLEQTAVVSYEKRIQRLMNAITPELQTGPTGVASARASHGPRAQTRPRQQPVQRPVANRLPKPKSQNPSWARSTQQVQAKQNQVRDRAELSRRMAEAAKQNAPAAQPKKKRFKLWPFK